MTIPARGHMSRRCPLAGVHFGTETVVLKAPRIRAEKKATIVLAWRVLPKGQKELNTLTRFCSCFNLIYLNSRDESMRLLLKAATVQIILHFGKCLAERKIHFTENLLISCFGSLGFLKEKNLESHFHARIAARRLPSVHTFFYYYSSRKPFAPWSACI